MKTNLLHRYARVVRSFFGSLIGEISFAWQPPAWGRRFGEGIRRSPLKYSALLLAFIAVVVGLCLLRTLWVHRPVPLETNWIGGCRFNGIDYADVREDRVAAFGAVANDVTGFPADPGKAHQMVCEFWPSEFARLFRQAGLPRVSPPALAGGRPGHDRSGGAGPRIVSPRADRTYHLRLASSTAMAVDLEASAETARDRLFWFIDSTYLGTSSASTPLSWQPVAGRHVIRAVDELGRADSRVINVVAVE